MLLHLLILSSLQINRMFLLQDVIHIIQSRTNTPKITLLQDISIETLKSEVHTTKPPKFVIVSLKSDKLHMFLHDYEYISRCVWGDVMQFKEKKEIILNMLQWWDKEYTAFDANIVNYEDKLAYIEVLQDLSSDKNI